MLELLTDIANASLVAVGTLVAMYAFALWVNSPYGGT